VCYIRTVKAVPDCFIPYPFYKYHPHSLLFFLPGLTGAEIPMSSTRSAWGGAGGGYCAGVMAAEPGFEPGLEDPKSPVLPLHNSAEPVPVSASIALGAEGRTRTDTEIALQQFLRLSRLPLPPLRHKRKTRFELATSSLARKRSTTELLPHLHLLRGLRSTAAPYLSTQDLWRRLKSYWCRGSESN
jgi:hypothetical protein